MLRFAANAYKAVAFLLTDLEENDKRLPEFVLVVPLINRQIMDLWFILVYLMDDFEPRSLLYEQTAYRELRIQTDVAQATHGSKPDWQDWFEDMAELKQMMEAEVPLTPKQKADPRKNIPSWPHSHGLTEKPSQSQDFLKFAVDLIYGDTSIEAHLKPSGMLLGAGLLTTDIAPDRIRTRVKERTIHQYKFRHFCRTVIALLGVISEIENYCHLNNKEQAAKVWERLAEYNEDAKEIYERRYKSMLAT
jgi:hypothetical protein